MSIGQSVHNPNTGACARIDRGIKIINGIEYYLSPYQALRKKNELNKKEVIKEVISIKRTIYDRVIDVYTGKKKITTDIHGRPMIRREYVVQVYGYRLL